MLVIENITQDKIGDLNMFSVVLMSEMFGIRWLKPNQTEGCIKSNFCRSTKIDVFVNLLTGCGKSFISQAFPFFLTKFLKLLAILLL